MSHRDFPEIIHRLNRLETSIYRDRCCHFRKLESSRRAVHDKIDVEYNRIFSHADRSYHSLACELRALTEFIRSELKNLDPNLDFPLFDSRSIPKSEFDKSDLS